MSNNEKYEGFDFFIPNKINNSVKDIISPKKLDLRNNLYENKIIEDAYDKLDMAVTAEEFYESISLLVFHARHLDPLEHTNIARLLRRPFKRKASRSPNSQLHQATYEFAEATCSSLFKSDGKKRRTFVAWASKEFETSHDIVRRSLRDAEKKAKARKNKK